MAVVFYCIQCGARVDEPHTLCDNCKLERGEALREYEVLIGAESDEESLFPMDSYY